MRRTRFTPVALAVVLAALLAVGGTASAAAEDQGNLDTEGFHPPDGYFEAGALTPTAGQTIRVSRPAVDVAGSSGEWVTFAYSHPPGYELTWQTVTPGGQLPPCVTAFPGATFAPLDAAFDGEGRLLVSGEVGYGDDTLLFVARFLYPTCTLDASFDGDGYFTFAYASELEGGRVGFVTTGLFPFLTEKILLAGTVRYDTDGIGDDGIVLRLLPDGTLDGTFSSDGVRLLEYDDDDTVLLDFVVDPQDRIVVVGTADTGDPGRDVVLTRLLADGTVDPEFGVSGWRRFHQTSIDRIDIPTALLRAPGGDLHLVGISITFTPPESNRIVVTRLSGNGASLGEAVWPVGQEFRVRGAALQGHLRLLVAGDTEIEPAGDFFTMAYRIPQLVLDPTYNDLSDFDPMTTVDLDNALVPDALLSGLVLSNGRPVLAGMQFDGSHTVVNRVPFLARLENDLLFADGFESGSTVA